MVPVLGAVPILEATVNKIVFLTLAVPVVPAVMVIHEDPEDTEYPDVTGFTLIAPVPPEDGKVVFEGAICDTSNASVPQKAGTAITRLKSNTKTNT